MYKAYITPLKNVREHWNADKLMLATVLGNQIVIGKTYHEGQMGVYFPPDGQLSQEFADANNLIEKRDEEGKKIEGTGYLSHKRRIRSMNLRSEKSEGLWLPVESLEFTGVDVSVLQEGYEFDELNGVPICNKYFTPATLKAQGTKTKRNRSETTMFHMHIDTEQFKYKSRNIPSGLITLTEKLHGTSGRYGHVIEEREPTFWERLLIKFGFNVDLKRWTYLMGTRRVICNEDSKGFYDSDEFRHVAIKPLEHNLHKGEVVYFELVGYTTTGQPIMPMVYTSSLKDIEKVYGTEMYYNYGCVKGQCKLFVYRIVNVNEDGVAIDLPWSAVERRCRELGVEHVPVFKKEIPYEKDRENDTEMLSSAVEKLTVGPSTIDPTHIREGVVVRCDYGNNTPMVLKNKSFEFGVFEGYIKEQEEYVDMEEAS